ncbi:MAG: ribosome silencing factor [Bacillota bacterium]
MDKLTLIKDTLEDLQLEDIIVYDVKGQNPFFDYFIISSAKNPRQLRAAILRVKNALDEANLPSPSIEGKDSDSWVLIDASDIIVNVFSKEEREYYNIEKMWHDVPRLEDTE